MHGSAISSNWKPLHWFSTRCSSSSSISPSFTRLFSFFLTSHRHFVSSLSPLPSFLFTLSEPIFSCILLPSSSVLSASPSKHLTLFISDSTGGGEEGGCVALETASAWLGAAKPDAQWTHNLCTPHNHVFDLVVSWRWKMRYCVILSCVCV